MSLAPTLELLSLGSKNPVRHLSDHLPCLPRYRTLFAKLPTEVAEMELKVLKISLNDLESVTKTVIQVRESVWHLLIKRGVDNQFIDWDRWITKTGRGSDKLRSRRSGQDLCIMEPA